MPLIFGDDRLDQGQFPHLMPERVVIRSSEPDPAVSTGLGTHCHDRRPVLSGNKRLLVLLMPRLAPAVLLRLLACR